MDLMTESDFPPTHKTFSPIWQHYCKQIGELQIANITISIVISHDNWG